MRRSDDHATDQASPSMTSTPTAIDALSRLPLAVAIRESAWAFPLLEIVHIAAIASMVGSVLTVEMRVFGLRRSLPLEELGRLGAVIAVTAFAVAVASGSLLFASDAAGYVANRAFVAKLGLILAAGINMLVFHARGSLAEPDAIAKVQAALSLLLWLGVIAAGRLIAYV
jgi:hypothetical protein